MFGTIEGSGQRGFCVSQGNQDSNASMISKCQPKTSSAMTSEAHVHQIMSTNEYINKNTTEKKVLEASLKNNEIDLHFTISLCVIHARETFTKEFKRHMNVYI
jgi:hypothetical protein